MNILIAECRKFRLIKIFSPGLSTLRSSESLLHLPNMSSCLQELWNKRLCNNFDVREQPQHGSIYNHRWKKHPDVCAIFLADCANVLPIYAQTLSFCSWLWNCKLHGWPTHVLLRVKRHLDTNSEILLLCYFFTRTFCVCFFLLCLQGQANIS